jgi:hypothetical protein
MLKEITILFLGTFVGAVAAFAVINYTNLYPIPATDNSPGELPEPAIEQEITFEEDEDKEDEDNEATEQQRQAAREDLRDRLKTLHTQIYKEGVTVQAISGKAYPGLGFMASDDEGTKIFVAWTDVPPPIDTTVAITGTLKAYQASNTLPGQQGPLPEEVSSFLAIQSNYIQADEIASSDTTERR